MSKNIIIVDDSNSIRKMVEFTLKTKGHNVIAANDGQDGLDKLSEQELHLIILDINMPRVDGFQFLETVRKNPAYENIPIVMLTTEGQDEDRQKAMGLGASDYMVKPFKPTELIEKVNHMLSNDR